MKEDPVKSMQKHLNNVIDVMKIVFHERVKKRRKNQYPEN